MRNTHFVANNNYMYMREITRVQNFRRFVSLGITFTGQNSIYYEELSQLNVDQFVSIRQNL